MPHRSEDNAKGVIFNDFPKVNPVYANEALLEKYSKFMAVKNDVSKALEFARSEKTIGKSLEAAIEIKTDAEHAALLRSFTDLKTLFIVSEANVVDDLSSDDAFRGEVANVKVKVAEGSKCERCWTVSKTVGTNAKYPTVCLRCAERLE